MCEVVAHAKEAFGQCGLLMEKPLTVTNVSGIEARSLNCIGIFDCSSNAIRVLHPDAIRLGLRPDNAFDRLPVMHLFESVIPHELAHAFLHASSVFEQVPHTEAEYVAYALQMDALEPDDRQTILNAHTTSDPGSLHGINEVVLALSSSAIAALSWRHFIRPGNGRTTIGKIVSGKVLFPLAEI